MYKYRGRQTLIVFGEPLPARPLPPKPMPKNIVAEALKVKAYLNEDPQRTYRHTRERFKVTKARISQLMKIADVLPQEFVAYMGGCQDQVVIRRFSGKTLLRIAGLESPMRRQKVISDLMKVETHPFASHNDVAVIYPARAGTIPLCWYRCAPFG